MTKAELYALIDWIAKKRGHDRNKYPWDMVAMARQSGVNVEYCHFQTRGLRGLALPREELILLNRWLTKEQKNFYCAHEYFHIDNHAGIKQAFNCFENHPDQISTYYEWEANEGAAEFLLPYKALLPIIAKNLTRLKSYTDLYAFRLDVARHFFVPEQIVIYRIEHLRFEIQQYLNGVPLNQIEILSLSEQARYGITAPSLNEQFGPTPSESPARQVWKEKVFAF